MPTTVKASAVTAKPGTKPGWAAITVIASAESRIHESEDGVSFELEIPRATVRQLAKTLKGIGG
jgi:hypothetical protein